MRFSQLTLLLAAASTPTLAQDNHRPFNVELMLDELEYRLEDGVDPSLSWSTAVSAGTDRHSLWLISEDDHTFDKIGGNELRAYYSHGLDSGWSINLGWRGDEKPEPNRDWSLLGIEGETPGAVRLAATVYATDGGDSAFRLEMERGFDLATNWELTPELKADFYGQDTRQTGHGSGFSTLELAVRLAYEWTPWATPYVGAIWGNAYGSTADYVETDGGDRSTTQFLVGISLSLER